MNDDRPIYSDTGYFTRGRSGYRPEVKPKETYDAWWAVIGLMALVGVFVVVHTLLPNLK